MNYWLIKSEPEDFSIDDLKALFPRTEPWDGVRNYQARNMMRDQMRMGDMAFFYHSNCKEMGIVGIMEIVRESYPDYTSWDSDGNHFDPKSTEENPRWFMVDVNYQRHLSRLISLSELKRYSQLSELPLVKRGNRLSLMPVQSTEWEFILSIE